MEYQFHKVGGILIKDRKLLVSRNINTDFFIAPGGKVEKDETEFEALHRELGEELGIKIDAGDVEKFGTFYAPAAGNEKYTIRMDVYTVKTWSGVPTPTGEIEELVWIKSTDTTGMKIGSIFEKEVLPRLKECGLID